MSVYSYIYGEEKWKGIPTESILRQCNLLLRENKTFLQNFLN